MPDLIAAADWSAHPSKRWCVTAKRDGESWLLSEPRPVGPLEDFFPALRRLEPAGRILAGFDFPIGLPASYAHRAEIRSFPEFLARLPACFCQVTQTPSLEQPFYPQTPKSARKQNLVHALGLTHPDQLLRRCDRATHTRRKACEIFWTVGPNQVGRAAICGWRDLLAPALLQKQIALWPFEGSIDSQPFMAAEIYPAETYTHLGLTPGFGKTARKGRQSQIPKILDWCRRNRIRLGSRIEDCASDDPFDAILGAIGMIEAVTHSERFAPPPEPDIRMLEGWIFGMPAFN